MTPDHIRALLSDPATGLPALPPLEEPVRLLTALEQACDREPANRAIAELMHEVHALATASDGLPPTIAGVRRERIVRWDAWSTTWDGTLLATGQPARIRTLRAGAARDPVLRRALLRDGRLLGEVLVEPVGVHDGAWPAIVAPLPGPPLAPAADPDDHTRPIVLARMLGTALVGLGRWESRGFAMPPLASAEVLDTPVGVRILCLTPTRATGAGAQVAAVARTLSAWWGEGPPTPVDPLLAGIQAFPPHTVAEAVEAWCRALAEHLASERHRLHEQWVRVRQESRAERLRAAIDRLQQVAPPPQGRGAVGVDLDGHTTILESRDGRVTWGPRDAAVEVHVPERGLEVREARRLLRTRAETPSNPRLQASVGGDGDFVDATCRWVAAALQLRTVRLLLEARAR